jgi:hypothetical protein
LGLFPFKGGANIIFLFTNTSIIQKKYNYFLKSNKAKQLRIKKIAKKAIFWFKNMIRIFILNPKHHIMH